METKMMKAAVLFGLNTPLKIIEVPVTSPGEGQVLVKLAASGICHTQILEITGKNATGDHTPNLMGHEGSGVVEEVGPGVTKVKKGDHVILSWIKGSGKNSLPDKVDYDGQKLNRGFVTTFNEYCIASENRVTPIPEEMPLREAALIGCAVATGAGAVLNNAKVERGKSVMVIGAGGIGINMIHAASYAGADPIIAVDINEKKLDVAKRFGATHVLNSTDPDLKVKLDEIVGVAGLDYAFETVGKKHIMEFAYDSVNKFSGRAVLCGMPAPGLKIEIDPFPLFFGRRLVGTGGGETDPDTDFLKFCRMYMDGKYDLSGMISHVIRLEEINEGIDLMLKGECLRVVVDYSKQDTQEDDT